MFLCYNIFMDFRKPSKIGKKYRQYQAKNGGRNKKYNFYNRVLKEDKIIEKRDHFVIVENLFSYDIWDGYGVKHHLLVISKKFTESISTFSEEERAEYWQILADYESRGYAIYARAPGSKRKTVKHQHTHLILPNYNKRVKLIANWSNKFLWWKNF